MAVSIRKARDFVYSHGVMWEKALFGYLFGSKPLAHVHQCLLCYRNPDAGWGHGLEHDIKCPESHPLALEFMLSIARDTGIPLGCLLEGVSLWVETHQHDDGSLKNPASIRDYPLAPWWVESGGQHMPDSITGNLLKYGACSPAVEERTRGWVQKNLTLERIQGNEWLFMAYHAFDYFMNVQAFTNSADFRRATIDNIVNCAKSAPEKQYAVLFQFAPTPDSPVAQALPPALIERYLDCLSESQRDDGGWDDEHDLLQWKPYTTIRVLLALQRYGRLNAW